MFDDDAILVSLKAHAIEVYGAKFFQKPTPLMWFFGLFVERFNPRFQTHFTTTVGARVYWATRNASAYSRYRTLAHELVHFEQQRRDGALRFALRYAGPQLYALVTLGALGSLGAFWSLWALLCLACLPFFAFLLVGSKGRAEYEAEAYQMSHAVTLWRREYIEIPSPFRVRSFTGPDYLWMDRDEERVRARLSADIEAIKSGEFEERSFLARLVRATMANPSGSQ